MGSCLSVDGDSSYPSSPSSVSGYQKVGKNSRKRHGIGNSSFDSKRETQLHKVSGRMVANGANTVASLFTQQGKKGTNQDAMIVWENFGSRTDTVFCGVFDGHGPFGHMVARRVRDSLPLKLSAHWEINISQDSGMKQSSSRAGSMNPAEISSVLLEKEVRPPTDIEEKENHPDIFLTLKQSFLKAFKVMDKELKVHPHIDCFCSGTTAVTLVKQGQDLVIGNVGDSRAIIGSRDQDDCLVAIQLTVDLKPNLPREAERIRKCKGRVFALQDEPEVARIWLPNYDSPGLAMARAFGDFCLKDFGLISVPEVSYRRLSEKDEFVVLATDGIWDVLSNKEVVDIVASAPARACAARALVETAVRAWRFKYPTSKVDDCAVICLFLDSSPNSFSTATNKKKEHQSIEESNMESGEMQQNSGSLPTLEESEITQQEESDSDLKGGGEEWSALEGVARVNTLLTLPRFVPSGNDKRLKK